MGIRYWFGELLCWLGLHEQPKRDIFSLTADMEAVYFVCTRCGKGVIV